MTGFNTEEVSYEIYYIKCAFPKTIVNKNMEIIVEPKTNEYFLTADCYTKEDIQAKVLEWLSRGAYKTEPYKSIKKNREFREYMQNGINDYLGMDFTQEDFGEIYQYLGNRVNHEKTIRFIKSGFDMGVLESEGGGMTRENIEGMREVILPFVKKKLLEINYENLGKSDAEEFEKHFNEILDLAIKALEQEPKWIPVSERLPNHDEYIKNNGLFIVSDGNRSYSEWFDIYDKQKFGEPTMSGFRVDYAATAWMSLPEAYESQENK